MRTTFGFDPFAEATTLGEAMQHLLRESVVRPSALRGHQAGTLPMRVIGDRDELTVVALVPGIDPEHIEVTVHGDVLTIAAERDSWADAGASGHTSTAEQSRQVLVDEIWTGRISRSLLLPFPVEADEVATDHREGVLVVRLPKAERAKPKRIAIRSRAGEAITEPAIEAGATTPEQVLADESAGATPPAACSTESVQSR